MKKITMSDLESEFLFYWQQFAPESPMPQSEYVFAKPRKWRFDFAFVDSKTAIELDGGTYSLGRHTRGLGFEHDCDKLNMASALGWRVFRFTRGMLRRDPIGCIDLVRNAVDPLPLVERVK